MWANVTRVRISPVLITGQSKAWISTTRTLSFLVCRVCTTRPRHSSAHQGQLGKKGETFTLYLCMPKTKNGGFCNLLLK